MEENKTINFIKNMWEGTIKPTFSLMLKKSKENTDTIAKAIEDKSDISVNNFDMVIYFGKNFFNQITNRSIWKN